MLKDLRLGMRMAAGPAGVTEASGDPAAGGGSGGVGGGVTESGGGQPVPMAKAAAALYERVVAEAEQGEREGGGDGRKAAVRDFSAIYEVVYGSGKGF